MKLITFIISILLLITIFSSCLDLDVDPQYYADAIIVSRVVDNDTVYAIDAIIQSNLPLDTVVLYDTHSAPIAGLGNISYNRTVFELNHKAEDYTTASIEKGNYTFQITLEDGTISSIIDYLTQDVLDPFEVSEVNFDSTTKTMQIKWDEVDNADYYSVRIFKNDTIVLSTNRFISSYKSIELTSSFSGWPTTYKPMKGDSLTVLILSILMENNYSSEGKMQSISYSNKEAFVWGE